MSILVRDDESEFHAEVDAVRAMDVRRAEARLQSLGLSPDEAFECVRLFGCGDRDVTRWATQTINRFQAETD